VIAVVVAALGVLEGRRTGAVDQDLDRLLEESDRRAYARGLSKWDCVRRGDRC
jgi:hypothetical protein